MARIYEYQGKALLSKAGAPIPNGEVVMTEAEGKGAATLDGKMIDVAMYKMGVETVAKAEEIVQRAKQRAVATE